MSVTVTSVVRMDEVSASDGYEGCEGKGGECQ